MRLTAAMVACAAVVVFSGCGVASVTRSSTSETAAGTDASIAPPNAPTASSTTSFTTMDPSTLPSITPSQRDSTSPPPIVTPDTAQAERKLTLADAFHEGKWREADVRPAGKPEAVAAMQNDVSYYSSGQAEQTLELRFTPATGKLEADVAQAMNSSSSAERLQFTARADGRQVDVKTIAFASTAKLTVLLEGVTVVTISVEPAKSDASYSCKGSATALITRLAVIR